MSETNDKIKVVAVCDVYEKRKRQAQELSKAEFATLDIRALRRLEGALDSVR